MDTKKLLEEITFFSSLEIDSIHCYNHAIHEINQKSTKLQLENFRQDHRDHLEVLSALIYEFGGVSQNYSSEFKYFWNQSFSPVNKGAGPIKTLQILVSNESIISSHYESFLPSLISCDLRAQIEDHFEDEQDHIIYIEEVLAIGSAVA